MNFNLVTFSSVGSWPSNFFTSQTQCKRYKPTRSRSRNTETPMSRLKSLLNKNWWTVRVVLIALARVSWFVWSGWLIGVTWLHVYFPILPLGYNIRRNKSLFNVYKNIYRGFGSAINGLLAGLNGIFLYLMTSQFRSIFSPIQKIGRVNKPLLLACKQTKLSVFHVDHVESFSKNFLLSEALLYWFKPEILVRISGKIAVIRERLLCLLENSESFEQARHF